MRGTISRSLHFYARIGVCKHMNWACSTELSEWNKGKIFALTKSQRSKRELRSSLWWLVYAINSVVKTKLSSYTPPTTQHHSFFRNYLFYSSFSVLLSCSASVNFRLKWKKIPTSCLDFVKDNHYCLIEDFDSRPLDKRWLVSKSST